MDSRQQISGCFRGAASPLSDVVVYYVNDRVQFEGFATTERTTVCFADARDIKDGVALVTLCGLP